MRDINRLGLRVVGVTIVLFLIVFGLYWGGRALLNRGIDDTPLSLTERQRDTDGDGVADLYEELYYNTNPDNKDSDGDGTSDLDEILAGRDPAAAGPEDESRPATGELVTTQDTFTKKYLASLPTDIARDDILNQSRLTVFVEANKGELLPVIPPETLKFTTEEGAAAVKTYLDATSAAIRQDIKPVTSTDLEAAFRLQVNSGSAESMQTIIASLENNLTLFKATAAPAEVRDIHTRLVAATQALLDNARLLRNIDNDFVGGLIAARKIEELGGVYQTLAADIQALEQKYDLE